MNRPCLSDTAMDLLVQGKSVEYALGNGPLCWLPICDAASLGTSEGFVWIRIDGHMLPIRTRLFDEVRAAACGT